MEKQRDKAAKRMQRKLARQENPNAGSGPEIEPLESDDTADGVGASDGMAGTGDEPRT